ncbi:hypothetical protein [Spiroplasma turonicum]|uniref:Asp23/Gls24 family envelope stress response protein n=1 Tax=Spiroplasma turonicum TaxID=216946 RepID=A0A0K1P6B3_9MOLU|nr:hypothetical protein [Spiroplasma turonicum]AKU79432.1 hypothetical protein STURON_00186 [Spiroplasma turonicum]ALX70453.1 hypothetical protein STURO_v1c01840 [Spiroplasma turonicum]
MEKDIIDTIKNTIYTIPGISSLANYTVDSYDISTDDVLKAVEISKFENIYKVKLHLVLINGVNIKDVLIEAQSRLKYELERNYSFKVNFIIDVVVDDLN